MNENDFMVAVGEAAQDAVWETEHPLTHLLEEDNPLRAQYLRDYQATVGRQVMAAIMRLQGGTHAIDAGIFPGTGAEPRRYAANH